MSAVTRPAISQEPTRKEAPLVPASVRKGDFMLVPYFVKVDQVFSNGTTIAVTDINSGNDFEVRGDKLVAACFSADQYSEEIEMSRTKVVEILVQSFNVPFTVVFDKQPDKSGKVEERTLRGILIEPEPMFGRSRVRDVDVTERNDMRLVDHRTIKSLIVKGVKYTVKG